MRIDTPARLPARHKPGLIGAGMLILAVSGVVHAHSPVDEVTADLKEKERYLEVVDREPPPFNLSDADGKRVALTDFAGKVVVLNFLYARCRDVCPPHSALLAKVQQQLRDARLVEGIQFVTIATDTEDARATAESMRQHGPNHGLDPANWVFLYRGTDPPDTTVQLAERYGLQFSPTPDGAQMHGVVTHVIDPDGRLRARFHGLKFAPLNLIVYVAALLHGDHREKVSTGSAIPAEMATDASGTLSSAWHTWGRLVIGLLGLALVLSVVYAWRRDRSKP